MDMFYKLQEMCPAATNLARLDSSAIGIQCLGTDVFIPSGMGLIVVLAHVILVPGFLIWARVAKKEDAGVVIGTAIESAFYVALGGYGGLAGGVIMAMLIPPVILGIIFAILSIVGIIFMIVALVRGTGDAGWKAAGCAEMLIFIAGLVTLTIFAFNAHGGPGVASDYETMINATALALAVYGAFHGFFASYARGMMWFLSPVLIPLNASWGFIGNILGLFNFLGSWNCWADHGKPSTTRKWGYILFDKGMSLKTDASGDFAFTEGAVVSAQTSKLELHEMIHAIQHYVWGPLYPISHNVWFVLWMILVAPWAALANKMGVVDAVTALSYYDNPWEVVAYEFYGGRDPTKDLIWSKGVGWTVAVLWILAWTLGGIFFILWRTGQIG